MWQMYLTKGLLIILAAKTGLLTGDEARDALQLSSQIRWRQRASESRAA